MSCLVLPSTLDSLAKMHSARKSPSNSGQRHVVGVDVEVVKEEENGMLAIGVEGLQTELGHTLA